MPLDVHLRVAILVGAGAALALPFSSAHAQTPAPPAGVDRPLTVSWQVAAGYHQFALRDIARTGRPVDGSPTRWRGKGAAFLVQHARTGLDRRHRLEASAAFAGGFVYDSGLQTIARPGDERYRRAEARYEYTRYPFRDVAVTGLDVGIGVQGIGARSSIVRQVPVDIRTTETTTTGAVGIVAAARLGRGSRVDFDLTWTNGLVLARLSERHSAAAAANRTHAGGGWLTDLSAVARVRLAGQASLAVTYFRTNDGVVSSHHNWTTARSSMAVGVTYAK